MATIPNLAPQPDQPFQPQLHASVQTAMQCVHFSKQTNPLTIETLVIPDQLMMQVIAIWLKEHPTEATAILQALKRKQSAELDIIRSVQASKNG